MSSKEREQLEAEIAKLKHELEDARARLLIAERQAEPEPAQEERKQRYYPAQEKHTAPPVTPETAVAIRKPETLKIPSFAELLDEYRHWLDNVPEPPEEYKDLGRQGSAWIKYVSHIYLVGRFGLSAKMEILELIGRGLNFKGTSGSLGKKTDNMDGQYLVSENYSVVGSHIKYVRLTPQGRVLYKTLFGKEPVETEWERLIRLHRGDLDKAHAAACSLFALQARWRGYATTMLPTLPQAGKARPDILIEKGDERLAVEVELSTKDNITKWRNLAGINGGLVALCAGTEARRKTLAGDCRREKLPGMSTDIEFFRSPGYGKDGHDHTSPLWAEQWT
jgi:hypothetical protein